MVVNILKRFWREVVIVVLVIVVAFSVKQCSKKNSDIRVLRNAADSAFVVAKYYVNKNNELVGQVKTQELTMQQLKRYTAELGFDKKKLEGKVGKLSRIVAHWQGSVRIPIEVPPKPLNPADTTNQTVLDNSFDLDSALPIQVADSFKTVNFSLTAFYKKEGLFKPRQLVADMYFDDGRIRVQEFKGFVIREAKIGFWQTPFGTVTVGVAALGVGYGIGRLR